MKYYSLLIVQKSRLDKVINRDSNWNELSEYFKHTQSISRVVYTTNMVEGFNWQIRKITKSKGVFPTEDALIKLVWLVTQNILKKWTSPLPKWALVIQQLAIHFEDRVGLHLTFNKTT